MTCPRCSAPTDEQTLREFGGVCPKCLLDFSEEQDAPAFPNLEILEMLGQGGMGVVYKAKQKNLDRIVALKVLSPQLSDDPEFVERFTREAKALAQLSHPNIVGIYDSGIHDRVPYLVMEYIDGTPLRKMLASGKMTPDRALEVIPQICDALQYAHTHGVVHRDIKPENILIDRQGRVKIADFGLAKLSKVEESRITQSGYVMGTPRYMAPEQFEAAGRVDHRADIYSLGVVFYEMLTGEVPMGRFKPPSAKADVDRRLDPVVLKSLEREPEDRYQSAGEVRDEVAGLNTRPVVPAAAPPISRPLRKAAGIILVMAVLALAPGVLLAWAGLATGKLFTFVGGSLLMASLVLGLFSLAFRPDPDPSIRRESLHLGGCLLVLVLGGLGLFVLFGVVLAGKSSPPPPLPPKPAIVPPQKASDPGFSLKDSWPAEGSLHSLVVTDVPFAKAKEELGLDAEVQADIHDLRRWRIVDRATRDRGGDHRCVLTGVEFKNEASRKRWQKTIPMPDLQEVYSGGPTLLWIQHDHTPEAGKLYLGLHTLVRENVRTARERETLRREGQPRKK